MRLQRRIHKNTLILLSLWIRMSVLQGFLTNWCFSALWIESSEEHCTHRMHNLQSPSDIWLSWMERLYISWEACRHCLHAIVNSFHTSHLEAPDIINLSIWNLANKTDIHSTERAFYHKGLVKNLEFATNYVQVLAILRDLWKAFFRQGHVCNVFGKGCILQTCEVRRCCNGDLRQQHRCCGSPRQGPTDSLHSVSGTIASR